MCTYLHTFCNATGFFVKISGFYWRKISGIWKIYGFAVNSELLAYRNRTKVWQIGMTTSPLGVRNFTATRAQNSGVADIQAYGRYSVAFFGKVSGFWQ